LVAGSGIIEDSNRKGAPQSKEKPSNYGLFLGGSSIPPRSGPERAKTAESRAAADSGITMGSNDNKGFVRDRSVPFARNRDQFVTQATGSFDNRDADTRSVGERSRESQPVVGIPSPSVQSGSAAHNISAPHPNISIHDNKREYLKEKERKDLESLEAELKRERERLAKLEDQFQRDMDQLKEQHAAELGRVEEGHRQTLDMLKDEKDKVNGTLQETLIKETQKMEQLHEEDLRNKERLNAESIAAIKTQLSKESSNLESQLSQQNELREILEAVQKRTNDITEIVESSLRQREDELKRKEIELAKEERQIVEDEMIQIELEEKRLLEEERKLQLTKDMLLKLKQSQNEEVNRLREQRH